VSAPAPETPSARVLAPGVLAGQRIVVSGAGSGIGRAVSLRALELGADVVGIGRDEERLEGTAAAAAGAPGRFEPATCDVRDRDAVAATVERIGAGGELTGLVNNAGGQFFAPASEISYGGFSSVVDLNLTAVFNMCREVAARFGPAGGAITNISISGVNRGGMGMSHSIAARAGVLGLSRTLALEWAARRIRVNCIGPGTVLTEAVREEADPAVLERLIDPGTPLRRATSVEEVAEMCAYLLTPAGSLMTGQLIQIDGGSHIGPGLHMVEPDPAAAGSAEPGPGATGPGEPGPAEPDARQPEAARSDLAVDGLAEPGSTQPGPANPGSEKDDAVEPDAAKSESAASGLVKPDSARTGPPRPDLAAAGPAEAVSVAGLGEPSPAEPDSARSERAASGLVAPDSVGSGPSKPEAAKPDAAEPEAAKSERAADGLAEPDPAKPGPPDSGSVGPSAVWGPSPAVE